MLRAVVLAAGESTRMGAPKALLRDGEGMTFVARVLHTFCSAGVADITVVTGALHTQIVEAVTHNPPRGGTIRFARNPDPERGQLSSLVVGLDALDDPGVRAALVTLVDVPFVSPATVRAVVDEFERRSALIVRPVRGASHGHPVLFARDLFNELRNADRSRGAKAVLRAHESAIANVEVDDAGAMMDLDTPDEYARAVKS